MALCRLVRNRTASSAGFGVKSRRLSAVTKAARIEIGAVIGTACTIDERLLGRPEDLYGLARTPPAMDRQRHARQHRTRRSSVCALRRAFVTARVERVPARGLQAVDQFVSALAPLSSYVEPGWHCDGAETADFMVFPAMSRH
jgi:hypothetical protein